MRGPALVLGAVMLGALTSLSLAWGVGLRSASNLERVPIADGAFQDTGTDDWVEWFADRAGVGATRVFAAHGTLYETQGDQVSVLRGSTGLAFHPVAHPPPGLDLPVFDHARTETATDWLLGVPFRCVRAESPFGTFGCFLADRPARGLVPLPWGAGDHTIVRTADDHAAASVLPVWRGLIADTGIYACAWLGALAVPRSVRSIARRRRGRCEACGYPLAGLPAGAPCPECGPTTH